MKTNDKMMITLIYITKYNIILILLFLALSLASDGPVHVIVKQLSECLEWFHSHSDSVCNLLHLKNVD